MFHIIYKKINHKYTTHMQNILHQVKTSNSWSDEYTQAVLFEYERFLTLRSENETLSPSDDIDKFWHQHILNTKHYYEYCMTKFSNRFVHHNPMDACDQTAKQQRLLKTIKFYNLLYGNIINPKVWNLPSLPSRTENIKLATMNDYTLPTTKSLKPIITLPATPASSILKNNIYRINVKIMYIFDHYNEKDEFIGKHWKPSSKEFDNIIVTYVHYPHSTIDTLRDMIANKTGHQKIGIKIHELDANKKIKSSQLDENNKLSIYSSKGCTLIAILEEVSLHGYC